ncbi:HD family phosphohydrolase [Gordonia sputi]
MCADVVAEVEDVLRSLRGVWDEEAVDELDHALQAGRKAVVAGADDELVVAAVLHDVGHSPLVESTTRHDDDARAWLTPRFGDRVGWLAGSHVAAKKWLAAHDRSYAKELTATSVASLAEQGGAADPGAEWTRHPWWPDAIALRRFDDAAKVPGAAALTIDEVVVVARRVLGVERAGH